MKCGTRLNFYDETKELFVFISKESYFEGITIKSSRRPRGNRIELDKMERTIQNLK